MAAASPAALLPLLLADAGLPEPAGREPADWALGWHHLHAADWRCEQAAPGWPATRSPFTWPP